jgi:hypothetical protein
MTADGNGRGQRPTPADILLANQLYCAVVAQEYDQRITSGTRRFFATTIGFRETVIAGKVSSLVAFDATHRMLHQAKAKFAGLPVT